MMTAVRQKADFSGVKRTYSPLRGCSCEAALPAARSCRNSLYAI